jgi:ADP-ribose pyrophosphatase YjhB (NUDIX family)
MALVNDKGFTNGKNDSRRGIDFIGVTCAFVCHDGKGNFLLHKRSKNCRDEQGRWDSGGGAHEFGSMLEETVRREIKEEYNADVIKLDQIRVFEAHRRLNDDTPTHWVGILFAAQVDPEQAKNNEPFKIDDIGWFNLNNLPEPLHSQTMANLQAVSEAGILTNL